MHYSVRIDINIKEIVSSVLDLVKTECCQFGKLTRINGIEENLLNGIKNDSVKNVNIFFSLEHLHNKKQICHSKKAGDGQ